MAWSCSTTTSCILVVFLLGLASRCCYGFGSFGFDIHHRFSDPVKGILGDELLPEKDSVEYYVAMVHRDRVIRGRHLAANSDQSPLTFAPGNETFLSSSLGYLHYANVTVGTPSLWFLVALDTGSDLFWLPCDCSVKNCIHALTSSNGEQLNLNIYSPNASSTSQKVSCNSTFCGQCPSASSSSSSCAYQVQYLSNATSSTGILVEDVLHLITDDDKTKAVDAPITFGCGQIQTGTFLEGAAPNGLFGLGMENISVPSILAGQGLSSNSFSMCFGPDGLGRISFGDNGSSDQGETPFNLGQSYPTYNVSITQITVGENASQLSFSAIFDSGTSFTNLNDPAYTFISESFNSQVQEPRHSSDSTIPFEYCYELSPNQTSYLYPVLNLTMKGGDIYFVTDPTVVLPTKNGAVYCLGLLRSESVNIIGQNFMTGYRIVFDREKKVLGWKGSNCYDHGNSNSLPITPSHSPATSPLAYNPQATQTGNNSRTSGPSPAGSHSPKLNSFTYGLVMLLVSFFAIL